MAITDLRFIERNGKKILQFKESYTEYWGGEASESDTDWEDVRIEPPAKGDEG